VTPTIEALLSLVCGYSGAKRAERQLCMMQAYIDDSTESNSVLVLAGYLASVPQWLALTEAWQQELDVHPKIKSFKMNKLKNPAYRPRVERFYRIIEKSVSGGFYIAIPIAPLKLVCADYKIASRYRSPYYMAWILLISVFRKFYTEAQWNPPLDLIFDKQKEESFVTQAWHALKEKQKGDMSPFKDTPIFKSDDDVIALQTADLLAWWARKNWIKYNTFKNSEWLFPWSDKTVGGLTYLHSEMDEEKMRAHIKNSMFPPNDL